MSLNTSGRELPVALVDISIAAHFCNTAQVGTSTLNDGTVIGPLDLLPALIPARSPAGSPSEPAAMTVVILNSLPTPLSLVVDPYCKHGHMMAYPAITQPNAAGKTGVKAHQIPASRPDPLNPASTLYGLGVYGFADDGAGCAGAMMFSYKANRTDQNKGGPFIGLAFRDGLFFYADQTGVTADIVADYSGDMKAFYDATADDTPVGSKSNNETAVFGYLVKCRHLDMGGDGLVANSLACVTFWVRPNPVS